MALFVNSGGWKNIRNIFVNSTGVWRTIQNAWINQNGNWRKFYAREVNLTIGTANTNTLNANLRSFYVSSTGDNSNGPVVVNFTVAGNIGSRSTGEYALDTGTLPSGSVIKLILPPISSNVSSPANGMIAGRGGNGVAGGLPCCDCNGCLSCPVGGPAIVLNYHLHIVNSGIIGAGGQGGYAIAMNRQRNHQYGSGGGAGINVGLKVQRAYGNPTDGTYRYGGQGSFPPAHLGNASSGCSNPYQASWVVKNGWNLTTEGSGSFFGISR